MFDFKFKVTYVRKGGGSKTTFNKLSENAFLDLGVMLHDRLRPKRFTTSHAKIAKYTPRSKKYTLQKLARIRKTGRANLNAESVTGLEHPLRFSGESKSAANFGNIRATSKSVKVAYKGLRVFNLRGKGQRVNMHKEFTTYTAREIKQIERRYDGNMRDWLNEADLMYIFKRGAPGNNLFRND